MELLARMRNVEEQGQGSSGEGGMGEGGLALEVIGQKSASLTCPLAPISPGFSSGSVV